jgi:hypothetical protein
MADERKHARRDIGDVASGILYSHHGSHVGMNFAVKQVNAGHIERRRKRSILRRILIEDDTGTCRFHEKRNGMTRTRAAVVDFEINSLTGSDSRKRRPCDRTFEPVPRLVGETHGVNCATVSVHAAWDDRS